MIEKEDIPESITKVLGNTNKDIVNTIILDLINNSLGKSYIKVSNKVFNAIKKLKTFNYTNIYNKCHTKEELDNFELMFNTLYEKLLDILYKEDKNHNIYTNYLNNMSEKYLKNTTKERIVIDYIAGMTDDYFIREYKNYQDLT